MDRINGLNTVDIGSGRRGWRKQNKSSGIAGTEWTDTYQNGLQEEILAVIEGAGIAPDAADWTQLRTAIKSMISAGARVHVGMTDTGAVNAINAVVAPEVTAWSDGDVYILRPANTTTTTTPTASVSGLAPKTIVRGGGSAPAVGEIVGGEPIICIYNAALGKLEMVSRRRLPADMAGSLTNDGSGGLSWIKPLGLGQSWQDVTASRAWDVTYYNATQNPISVLVTCLTTGACAWNLQVNGVNLGYAGGSYSNIRDTLFGIVPPGGSYKLTNHTNETIVEWVELR